MFLIFGKTSILFFMVLNQFIFLQSMYLGSFVLHILTNICCFWSFWCGPFLGDLDVSYWSLVCIFLMVSNDEHFFMWSLVICMWSLEKCLFGASAHFWIRLVSFCWIACVLNIFLISAHCQIYDTQYFHTATFNFTISFFQCIEAFKFDVIFQS